VKVFQSTVRQLISPKNFQLQPAILGCDKQADLWMVGYHACGLAGKQRSRAGSYQSTLMDAGFVGRSFRPQVEAAKKKLA